ncbi:hypothetical protein BP5796_00251 [Coleophoma crateriformis]|uniref:Uncharacterized protein n=1 Tax=Coleophoma crateriformis TaxID=565419 RepID=A0A3D8T904_9HELO|nr:hypothetical protein BP5796_00251 [Coleophoma crateriformis]
MLRPTPVLRFQKLSALQRLFDPPAPLPLDPRESKKLLTLLTTSFRNQLNREHDSFNLDTRPTGRTSKAQQNDNTPSPRRRRASDGDLAARHKTALHLESVLTNPLFKHVPEKVSTSTGVKDPMVTFDRAVGRGLMELKYAKGCLIAKKNLITESPCLSIRDAMKESGAGLKVLNWLISSGTSNDLQFLKDLEFRRILLEFMVAEDLQHVAWAWLRREVQQYRIGNLESVRAFSKLLSALVRAEVVCSGNLDEAFLCISRVGELCVGLSKLEQIKLLGDASTILQHKIIQRAHRITSVQAYESFVKASQFRQADPAYHKAVFELYHPFAPNAASALAFFKAELNLQTPSNSVSKTAKVESKKYILLGIETANYLFQTQQDRNAEWIMARLQRDYPVELGLDVARGDVKRLNRPSRKFEEGLNVHLLAGLDLA